MYQLRIELRVAQRRSAVLLEFACDARVKDLLEWCAPFTASSPSELVVLTGQDHTPRYLVPRQVLLRESGVRNGWSVWVVTTGEAPDLPRPPSQAPLYPKAISREQTSAVEVGFPAPPVEPEAPRMPWIALTMPLLLGIIMFVLWQNPLTAAFLLLSPLMLVGGYVEQRRRRRRLLNDADKKYHDELDSAVRELEGRQAAELRLLERLRPGVHELIANLRADHTAVWSQSGLDVASIEPRVGRGEIRSLNQGRVYAPSAQSTQSAEASRMEILPNAPVQVPAVDNFAVCGAGSTEALAAVLMQMFTLHAPESMRCSVVVSEHTAHDPQWKWLLWLPHVQHVVNVADLSRCAHALTELTVILCTSPDEIVQVMQHRHKLGKRCVWLARAGSVPTPCEAWLDLTATPEAVARLVCRDGKTVLLREIERLPTSAVVRGARALASLSITGPGMLGRPPEQHGVIPRVVSLAECLSVGAAEDMVRRWKQTDKSVPIGRSAEGVHTLNLITEGPHALVCGTTGSGKSEFLQTWLTSMCLAYSPRELNVLFIDYKGGAAFAECVDLPHTVGLVTDLDERLSLRVFESLRAEIQYRERLLARHSSASVEELSSCAGAPTVPYLVIMVDEFATLAQEVPSFLDRIIDIAARGRSLGIRLVLATQHAGAHVTSALRANINIRVSLRAADRAASTAVIGDGRCAEFEPSTPGRAAVMVGHATAKTIQTASVHTTETSATRFAVRPLNYDGLRCAHEDRTPLSRPRTPNHFVSLLAEAAKLKRLSAPRKPWKEPLPNRVLWQGSGTVAVGDDTKNQRYTRISLIDLVKHHLVGFASNLAQMRPMFHALAAAGVCDSPPAAVQVVSSQPHAWSGIPVANTIPADDHFRVRQCLQRTVTELRRRRSQDCIAELSHVLVIFENLAETLTQLDRQRDRDCRQWLDEILRDGPECCINVVVGAQRPGEIPGAMVAACHQRVVFPLNSEHDARMLGVDPRVIHDSPPGRAVLLPAKIEVQFTDVPDVFPDAGLVTTNQLWHIPKLRERYPLSRHGGREQAIVLAEGSATALITHGLCGVFAPPHSGVRTALSLLGHTVDGKVRTVDLRAANAPANDARFMPELVDVLTQAVDDTANLTVVLLPAGEQAVRVNPNLQALKHCPRLILMPGHPHHRNAWYMPFETFPVPDTPGRGWWIEGHHAAAVQLLVPRSEHVRSLAG